MYSAASSVRTAPRQTRAITASTPPAGAVDPAPFFARFALPEKGPRQPQLGQAIADARSVGCARASRAFAGARGAKARVCHDVASCGAPTHQAPGAAHGGSRAAARRTPADRPPIGRTAADLAAARPDRSHRAQRGPRRLEPP